MKTLVFKDGVSVDFNDDSNLGALMTTVKADADFESIKAEFEKDNNLIGGTFDGNTISQTVYTYASKIVDSDGNIVCTFNTRPFTDSEIINARLADLEDAVAEM